MKAENRHYTVVWKKKRKNHLADRCKNTRCTICHWDKVSKEKDIQTKKQDAKDNQISE